MIQVGEWQRLSALIDEAWALEDDAARSRWLDALAATEPALAAQVRAALADAPSTTGSLPGYDTSLARALARREAAPDLAGLRLGAWQLDTKIGEGGMGQVWRARRADGLFDGEAAIKLLRGDLGSSALAARFARERALLARLSHPAIARLLDAGIAGADAGAAAGQAFLVLELAQGSELTAHVREQLPTLAGRVRLLLRVADAVAYAHARLVVHRDLKPSNVLVGADGSPKLLDFGIAALLDDDGEGAGELTRLTGRGLTLGYAAPEQVAGAPIGTAADVYSLGVMLYELATGTLPHGRKGRNRTALEHAVLHDEPRRLLAAAALADPLGPGRPSDLPAVRGDIEAICAKALRKDPAERYAGVGEFAADLQAWLEHRPVSARRQHWRHNLRLWWRRHALAGAAAIALVLTLAGGLGASLWQRERALQSAREANEVTQYLEELLASASPDEHGGNWPTVLQLLEKSRAELPQRFADSPDTRLRVLGVLTETYRRLNRLDVAVPLGRELVQGTTERWGAHDPRRLQAVYELAQSHQLLGQCDLSAAVLAPALPLARRLPRDRLDSLTLPMVSLAMICNARLGRDDEAERLLAEERALIDLLPADDPWHMGYWNHLQVLRSTQGRWQEALDAISRTRPFWTNTEPWNQREVITMERNFLVAQVRVGVYDRVDERMAALIARSERLLGRGNNQVQSMRDELARYHADIGDAAAALRVRDEALAEAEAARVSRPEALLPLRAQRLAAAAMARALPAGPLRTEAEVLLGEAARLAATLGTQRDEIAFAVARAALAVDDGELALRALAPVGADPQRRKARLLAQVARLHGDLEASARGLAEVVTFIGRGGATRLVPGWSAALDLAATRVQQQAPDAAAALDAAVKWRPPAVPAGHPLDRLAEGLREHLATGRPLPASASFGGVLF